MVKISRFPLSIAAVGFAALTQAAPSTEERARKIVGVQAHRGGLGLQPESTAYAFAYAMEIGANVLEMDMVFTKDGIPVIWHDHQISGTKCKDTTGNFVGKFIANITLAELKTLDCGSMQLSSYKQTKLAPGAQIQTLEEILDLVECYGDSKSRSTWRFTKLDPIVSNETFPLQAYIDNIIPILERRRFDKRTYIQSFDWRTLIGIKKKFPSTRTVALIDDTTIIRMTVAPRNWRCTANSPEYKPFVTKEIVKRAHKLGLQVVPWTVDDEVTINKLITDGVDMIISDYPERVKHVARDRGYTSGLRTREPRPQCLREASLPL
ncbi:PLC-like phosphodiesterase [Terfezia claveryi]|nr:PLC-like phosphodiesterase [Terfezia claveryi]